MENNPSLLTKYPVYLAYAVLFLSIITLIASNWLYQTSLGASREVQKNWVQSEKLIGELLYYDEALTMSATMAFTTGDAKWVERYNEFEEGFDKPYTDLLGLASYSENVSKFENVSAALFETEKEGFRLLKTGNKETAAALLQTPEYLSLKKRYTTVIDSLIYNVRAHNELAVSRSENRSDTSRIISWVTLLFSIGAWPFVISKFKEWRSLAVVAAEEDRKQNWLNSGLTQLDEILRTNHKRSDLFFSSSLNFLAGYLEAGFGVFYRIKEDANEGVTLMPAAAYACDINTLKSFKMGQGLLGQAALEKKMLVFNDIPENYINVSSGLGSAKPRTLLVNPIVFESKLKGVIELAFTEEVNDVKLTFLDKALGAIGSMMALLIKHEITERLLNEATELTSQLQHQGEALRSQQVQLLKVNQELSKAKQSKQIFLAHMSHEIRTPLNGMIGLSRLLKNTSLSPEQSRILSLMEVSSDSLLGIVNDILDLSKIEAGKLKIVRSEVDIFDLIESITNMMRLSATKKGLYLTSEIDPAIPKTLLIDPLRLKQVLMNLLSNAIKFTKKGGVQLSVRKIGVKDNLIQLEFAVTDTGIGIKADAISRIFNSFEQAEDSTTQKFGGTGLGLTIVKNIIELAGGKLSVRSEENKGSVFSFTNWYQPVVPAASEPDPVKPAKGEIKHVSILVAEDDSVNQLLIKHILEQWEVKYEIVENGKQVLDKLSHNNYDLILMDGQMEEMSGIEATRIIRTEFDEPKRSIPIISLSASALEEEQTLILEAGVNDHLSKPFDSAVLLEKMNNLLKQSVCSNPLS